MQKTKIVTIASNKGGVGKTITTKFLADYAALVLGYRVLVIDLDPQTNISNRYIDMVSGRTLNEEWTPPKYPYFDEKEMPQWALFPSSASIWLHGDTYYYDTHIPNLKIMPGSSSDLQRVENVNDSDIYQKVISMFSEYLDLEEVQSEFDYIFIDTRPSKGPLVRASLNASDYVVVPTEMESPSLEGFSGIFNLIRTINSTRSQDKKLSLAAILPNKIKNIRLHTANLEQLHNHPQAKDVVLAAYLRDLVAYKESMVKGGPNILDYPNNTPAKIDYLIVMELLFKTLGEK